MIITAGEFKGQKILTPDESITRPTLSKVRMAVFNTLQALMDFNGKSFYDMYAGSGIIGLEALSRGFDSLTSSEKNPKVVSVLKNNYKKFLSKKKINFVMGDAIKIAQKQSQIFDVVYIDPPYFSGVYENSLIAVRSIAKLVILEHVVDVDFTGWKVLKQKTYGGKTISFIEKE